MTSVTASRPEFAAAGLAAREVRRGAIALSVACAVMIVAVVGSYTATSVASAGGLHALLENPAVRALYGTPFDVTTAGGFTVWRAGMIMCVVAGLWAVLASTRVLRGEEEAGRWDLLLSTPVTRNGLTGSHLGVLGGVSVVVGLVVVVSFVGAGEPFGPAVLFAVGLALLTLTFVAVGAVTSQLFGLRRRAAGVAGAVLGVSFLVRMIADGSGSADWLRWASPLGWVENLQAFAGNDLVPLVPLTVTPVALLAVAVALGDRRDTDEGIIRDPGTAVARPRFLRDPLGFAWRQRQAGLVGWGVALVIFGVVAGGITKAFVDFIANDPEIADLTSQFGYTSLSTTAGFVASMDAIGVVVVSLYAVMGIHNLWDDEQNDRLDIVFAADVSRSSWLGAQTLVTSLNSLAALIVLGIGTWIGLAVTGVDFSLGDALLAVVNLAPIVVLFLGLALLLHGIRPQWGVTGAGGAVTVLFLLSFLGPAMNLPDWLVNVSPWALVPYVPADPVDWTTTIVMTLVGISLGILGFVGFASRDLQ